MPVIVPRKRPKSMEISPPIVQIGIAVAVGVMLGGLLAWQLRGKRSGDQLESLADDWQTRLDNETRQKNTLTRENDSLRAVLDSERAQLAKFKHAAVARSTELRSLQEKVNALNKSLFTLGAERDELGERQLNIQKSLVTAEQRVKQLETEFGKSREFYKGQLMSAFEQRKSLERKVDDAKQEHESLSNLLDSAKTEHEAVNNLLTTARARLDGLDSLEQKVIALEADNAQLKHDVATATRQAESAKRDSVEMAALKKQNSELAHCLESMENSRRQYEEDARRYRAQYDQSEDESETLRIKLGDIQERLTEMQEQHEDARKAVAIRQTTPPPFGLEAPEGDIDDLTEIVGIGKVFEAMLHRLGIYYFRQIASFGPAELARVNSELKEFKGRIEHDDWIGQAKELHFKKYGETGQRKNAV